MLKVNFSKSVSQSKKKAAFFVLRTADSVLRVRKSKINNKNAK